MLDKLSAQYYIGQLYIEPSEVDEGCGFVHPSVYDDLVNKIYQGPTVGNPTVLIKLKTTYIPLKSKADVPTETIQVPDRIIDDELAPVMLPSLEEVLFPTKQALEQLDEIGFIA